MHMHLWWRGKRKKKKKKKRNAEVHEVGLAVLRMWGFFYLPKHLAPFEIFFKFNLRLVKID
jgi:hypothetical protein